VTSVERPFVARNYAHASDNAIHSDPDIARRLGFAEGLVPGLTCYAFVVDTLAGPGLLGEDWHIRGRIRVRYLAPVYEGEELTVVITGQAADEGLAVEVRDRVGATRLAGTAGLRSGEDPAVPTWPHQPPPPELHPLDAEGLLAAEWLTTIGLRPTREEAAAFRSSIGMDPPGEADVVDPGFLARTYREAVSQTFRRLGPTVHTGSEVEHLRAVRYGQPLTVRGRVDRLFARRQRRYVTTDVVWYDDEDRPVQRASHTRIFRMHRP
jgi:acyl dehydratase